MKSVPYTLPDDGLVTTIPVRRCLNGVFYGPNIRHSLALYDELPYPVQENPFNERFCSPLATDYRAPNLPDSAWEREEQAAQRMDHLPVGTRIQIFSIITAINIKTAYYMEKTGHPQKPWKRMILSYHLSEGCDMLPHFVEEINIPADRIRSLVPANVSDAFADALAKANATNEERAQKRAEFLAKTMK